MNENDIFDDDGMMEIPTMRGSANLDIEDYARPDDISSSILDDELQEDVPSTPGRNPGAANAPDVQGTRDWDMLSDPGGMESPGMKQTTYGDSPWGPGSDSGYRPHSQQRTDMSLRALGEADLEAVSQKKQRSVAEMDDMMREPEVIDAVPVQETKPWNEEWHGERNQQPSNAEIDPMTIYDRTSYEYDDSSQDTIGNGIFSMEEGVTWRPRDGIFAHQYALPAYIGEEDELGVQQSAMWDSTANEWRVTQPSASGVTLARKVKNLKKAYSPFTDESAPMPAMRPEVTGPRSHIEAFGREAAKAVLDEARGYRPEDRSKFLQAAIDALGPGTTERCRKAADALIKMGYRPDVALEDALAHCVMHAAVADLTQKRRGRSTLLPRLDSMAKRVGRGGKRLQVAAQEHIQPLVRSNGKLRNDVGALYASPAARGIGAIKNGDDKTGPYSSDTEIPGGPASKNGGGIFRPRNLLIAAGIGVGGYFIWTNRKTIKKNVKKLLK